MRKYEIVLIAHPDLDTDSLNGVLEKVNGWISASNGEIISTDIWGKRRMAYRIQKQRDGQYVLITANLEPSAIRDLAYNIRFVESIMRSLITLIED